MLTLLALAAAIQATSTSAETPPLIFNTTSCDLWLSSNQQESAGTVWVAGFWSGLNTMSSARPNVGASAGIAGIVAEVKAECKRNPYQPLAQATAHIYAEMSKSGR